MRKRKTVKFIKNKYWKAWIEINPYGFPEEKTNNDELSYYFVFRRSHRTPPRCLSGFYKSELDIAIKFMHACIGPCSLRDYPNYCKGPYNHTTKLCKKHDRLFRIWLNDFNGFLVYEYKKDEPFQKQLIKWRIRCFTKWLDELTPSQMADYIKAGRNHPEVPFFPKIKSNIKKEVAL